MEFSVQMVAFVNEVKKSCKFVGPEKLTVVIYFPNDVVFKKWTQALQKLFGLLHVDPQQGKLLSSVSESTTDVEQQMPDGYDAKDLHYWTTGTKNTSIENNYWTGDVQRWLEVEVYANHKHVFVSSNSGK